MLSETKHTSVVAEEVYHNGHNGVSRSTQRVHINPIPRRDRCEYYAVTAVVYSAQRTYNHFYTELEATSVSQRSYVTR